VFVQLPDVWQKVATFSSSSSMPFRVDEPWSCLVRSVPSLMPARRPSAKVPGAGVGRPETAPHEVDRVVPRPGGRKPSTGGASPLAIFLTARGRRKSPPLPDVVHAGRRGPPASEGNTPPADVAETASAGRLLGVRQEPDRHVGQDRIDVLVELRAFGTPASWDLQVGPAGASVTTALGAAALVSGQGTVP